MKGKRMTDQETMSTRDALEGVKAMREMTELFREAREKISPILVKFIDGIEAMQGEDQRGAVAWFEAMGMVADLDVDDAQGGLIVALTSLAQIKVKIKGTSAEEMLRKIFHGKDAE